MKAVTVMVADTDADRAQVIIEAALGRAIGPIQWYSVDVTDAAPPAAPALPTAGAVGGRHPSTSHTAAKLTDATGQAGRLLFAVCVRPDHGHTCAEATRLLRQWWPSIARNQVAARMRQLADAGLVARRNAETMRLDIDKTAGTFVTRPTDDRGNFGAVWYPTAQGIALSAQLSRST